MKQILFLMMIYLMVLLGACQLLTSKTHNFNTGIEDRVYSIGSPAEPAGWTPPPLKQVSTIIVENPNGNKVKTALTNNLGKYRILLSPGMYYLEVKESFDQAKTGPFTVKEGSITETEADYDNGVR